MPTRIALMLRFSRRPTSQGGCVSSLLRLVERIIDAAAIAAFSGIFLCVIAQVVLRYLFNNPLTWSEELARYLFIWCAFLGWLVASRRHSHLAMTFVVDRLPG